MPERILDVEPISSFDIEIKLADEDAKRSAILRNQRESAKNRKGFLLSKFDKETVERAARLYKSNADAARALGLSGGDSFKRVCIAHGVEAPGTRKKREAKETI